MESQNRRGSVSVLSVIVIVNASASVNGYHTRAHSNINIIESGGRGDVMDMVDVADAVDVGTRWTWWMQGHGGHGGCGGCGDVGVRSGGNLIQVSVPSYQHASASACAHRSGAPTDPDGPDTALLEEWKYSYIRLRSVHEEYKSSPSIHMCY